jgi:hypothetical protein
MVRQTNQDENTVQGIFAGASDGKAIYIISHPKGVPSGRAGVWAYAIRR